MDILIFGAIIWLIAEVSNFNSRLFRINEKLNSIDSDISDIKDIIERDKK